MEEAIYLKQEGTHLFVKAVGHITASISASLRQKVNQLLSGTGSPTRFSIDLSSCDYMDSTFMGLLLGFNKRFEKISGRKIELPGPSAQCLKLLDTLGIQGFFDISDTGIELPDNMENLKAQEKASPEFLLNTHENLIEISEENKKRFGLLHNLLKKKMEEEGNSLN